MSDFSNDSIDFDTKDDFIEDINEEIDYYALLNVPKDVNYLFIFFIILN